MTGSAPLISILILFVITNCVMGEFTGPGQALLLTTTEAFACRWGRRLQP